LFRVEFVGNAAREKVDTDERNRWLSEDAIAGLQGDSGKLVSRTMTRLLNHLLSRRQHKNAVNLYPLNFIRFAENDRSQPPQ
jgi:hypothetical protein